MVPRTILAEQRKALSSLRWAHPANGSLGLTNSRSDVIHITGTTDHTSRPRATRNATLPEFNWYSWQCGTHTQIVFDESSAPNFDAFCGFWDSS